jgi:DNA-binding response OmpR family regulator
MQDELYPEDSTIVVIEDDFLKARLLLAALQTHTGSRRVFLARDGDQALRLIQEHHPDVILLNMNLSRPSGLEFLRLLQVKKNGMKVIAMTNQGQADLRAAATMLGATNFVETPYNPYELSDHVLTIRRQPQ